MDATPIDPRDETWEVRSPRYRVHFSDDDGAASEELELDAHDVVEALAWAEDHRGRRGYALYACVPVNGMGLVLLAGADPDAAQDTSATPESAQLAAVTDTLAHALAPVLRDLKSTRAPEPGIDRYGWVDDASVASAMLGGGTGLILVMDVPEPNRIAAAADQVQAWVIEELWGSASEAPTWPPCPHHPASHPLRSVVLDSAATWICPNDGDPIAPVGSLPAPD